MINDTLSWSLWCLWLWPLLLAILVGTKRRGWSAFGAWPALAVALLLPAEVQLELPWLLLGSVFGLDDLARIFLGFTALLWSVAGVHVAAVTGPQAARFERFFLLALAGNLWLIVSQDMVGFYAGFALMSLAAYGLIVHEGTDNARSAGRIYLIMTLGGEVLLFAALALIAAHTATLTPTPAQLATIGGWPIGLLLLGLAVKAGLVPLHSWLALAHPAAPVPASAVLSGAMIAVALLGWLRFLPLGTTALPGWGTALTLAGTVTLLWATFVGLCQTAPKVILAYSSIGKMGLLAVALGLMMREPALAAAGSTALAWFAAHHGLVKGGLFLGLGLRKQAPFTWQPPIVLGLALLALALVGAPLTTGALAKYGLKPVLHTAAAPVALALSVGTLGAILLMARWWWIVARLTPHPGPGMHAPAVAWALLSGLVGVVPLMLGSPAAWLNDAGTTMLGLILVTGALAARTSALGQGYTRCSRYLPPGDLLPLAGRAFARWRDRSRPFRVRFVDKKPG